MRVLIMSDTHDNMDAVEKVAMVFKEKKCDSFIHCGDVNSAKMVQALKKAGLERGDFIQGNMDEKNLKELKEAITKSGFEFLGLNSEMKFGVKDGNPAVLTYITHGDNENSLKEAIDAKKFDFIFYGHTHKKSIKTEGKTTIINVGALSKDTPKEDRGVFILDTITKKFEFVPI